MMYLKAYMKEKEGVDNMENNTNKVIELEDGKEYLVLKQILYKENTYYVTSELFDGGDNFDKHLTILKEEKENGDTFIEVVTDPKIIEVISKHLD